MKKTGGIFPILFFFSMLSAHSQDIRNFGFEQTGLTGNAIFPWTRTYYTNPVYQIVPDSTVSHSGSFSLRLTYDTVSKNGASGVLYNKLPLDVIGQKLRVSAWVKQSDPSDTSGTFSCVVSEDLGERRTLVKGAYIIHAKDWTFVSREYNLDSLHQPVHHLRINININSKDTVWIDDIKIEIDGKDIYSLPSFCSSKEEIIQPLTSQQISNLCTLARVWGFLKYFHPAVAAGKYNWDMELFKIIPEVKQATDNSALSRLLLTWINSLGEIDSCKSCYTRIPDELISYNLDQEWMEDNRLSAELRSRLKNILANRHMGDGHYAMYQSATVQFINENEYDWREAAYPNEVFRLQTVFRYWNTIQYFYPYKNIIGKDWNDVLKTFLPRFAEAKDLFSYRYALNELANTVNDSHSGPWDPLLRKILTPFIFPARVAIINDQAVITSFPDEALARAHGLNIGDVIEKIGDQYIKQRIEQFLPLINGSNHAVKLAYLCSYDYITGGIDSIVNLSVLRGSRRLHMKVRRYPNIADKNPKDTSSWKILPGNIGLVHIGKLQRKNVKTMFEELMHTKAIIFDLRHYPNGTITDICKYLYPGLLQFAKTLRPNPDYPGTYKWSEPLYYGPNATESFPHYNGRIILLVNSNTQSQGEWTAMAIQAIPGVMTIGSQTSGTDGNISQLYLTGNLGVKMTVLGVFYPDGTATQQTGIKIDMIVHPSVSGIREGRDELLEKAISVLNQRN